MNYLKFIATVFCLGYVCLVEAKSTQTLLDEVPQQIKACRQQSQTDWDSGVTSQMLQGAARYQDCLTGIIQQLAKQYYPREAFGEKGLNSLLADTLTNQQQLIGAIYNCPKPDYPSCGTLWRVTAAGAVSNYLEDIIRQMSLRIGETQAHFDEKSWVKHWGNVMSKLR